MPDTATQFIESRHHSRNAVVRVHFDARRCIAPPDAIDSHAIVERVLCGTQLDTATRDEMVRILTITVRQWLQA